MIRHSGEFTAKRRRSYRPNIRPPPKQVKEIELESQECISVAGVGEPGDRSNCVVNSALFNEPNDVVYSEKENVVYVVDTNNHKIKLLNLDKNQVNTMRINFIKRMTTETNNKIVKELPLLKVSKRNMLSFKSNFLFGKDFRPSKGATHFFKLNILGGCSLEGSPTFDRLLTRKFSLRSS